MNILMQTLRTLLQKCINDIDNGDCNPDSNEINEIISAIKKYTRKDLPMSKYQCCEYLNVSRATFDNLVKGGKIPEGKKVSGFKEKFWFKKDLDKAIKHGKNSSD